MFKVLSHTGGFTATNGYAFLCPEGPVLIDAPTGMKDWVASHGLTPVALLLTHAHFDHVMDAAAIVREWSIPVFAWCSGGPADRLEALLNQWMGSSIKVEDYPVDHLLAGVENIQVAGASLACLHVPGHSPDSVVFTHAESGTVFSGDTVMDGGIGRADLPGGDHGQLVRGIRSKILTLPPEWTLYPGHGDPSTVGWEKRNNMYLAE